MTKFVLLANARSGSTSLAKLLGESADVKMCIEPFHPKYSEWNSGKKNYHKLVNSKKQLHIALQEIFSEYTAFKTLVYQLPKELYLELLSEQDLKILFLTRKSLAAAALSSLIGSQTSVWHKSELDKNAYNNLKPIKIKEIEKIVSYIGTMNELYREYLHNKRKGDYLELTYEDLYSEDMDKNLNQIKRICEFLQISLPKKDTVAQHMMPSRAQLNTDHLYEQLPNYMEIKKHFKL